jgi:protein tyrosine/serine phosphatase
MKLTAAIRSKSYRSILLIFTIVITATAGVVLFQKTRPYHFLTVTPGVLYSSGWMSSHNQDKIIKKYGIRTVVNLCLPAEYPDRCIQEEKICSENKVELVNLPMQGNTPPSKEQIDEWLNLLSNEKKLPILVHCSQGVIRTGIMVAIYKMEFMNKDNQKTLAELPTFGHDIYEPKRKDMIDFILNYKKHNGGLNNRKN